jgi:hypothetical protein
MKGIRTVVTTMFSTIPCCNVIFYQLHDCNESYSVLALGSVERAIHFSCRKFPILIQALSPDYFSERAKIGYYRLNSGPEHLHEIYRTYHFFGLVTLHVCKTRVQLEVYAWESREKYANDASWPSEVPSEVKPTSNHTVSRKCQNTSKWTLRPKSHVKWSTSLIKKSNGEIRKKVLT